MRLFIHIGWPKTGSTALQAFCAAHPAQLAAHGVQYYRNRKNLPALNALAKDIRQGRDMTAERAAFAAWCDAAVGDKVLISAEQFATLDPAQLARVIAPERWERVTVIAYLRAQEAVLEGWYKQLVKWGNRLSLRDFLRQLTTFSDVEYAAHLGRWQAWCDGLPGGEMQVRLFERAALVGGDIGADMFATMGLTDPALRAGRDNPSPSAPLVELYLKLPEIKSLQKINRIMVASEHPAATGSGDLFSAELVTQIRRRFAPSNETVRARYFPARETLFAAPEPRATGPEETDGLADLLIETLRVERGEAVADAARRAFAE